MAKLDFNAVLSTASVGPLQIIRRARLDAGEALRTEDELRLRMAAQTGWLAISTLAKLVAGRVDRCRPPEGYARVPRPLTEVVDRARRLLQGEAFHEAKPEALAQVPDELAMLEQLIIDTLESLRTAAGPLGARA